MADAIMNSRDQRKLGFLTIPGIAVSLLPSLACPLCWPAYAELASSLGLGFLASSAYVLPLTGALLAIAVAGLGLQAKTRLEVLDSDVALTQARYDVVAAIAGYDVAQVPLLQALGAVSAEALIK
jgi:hypothetical protein